MLKNELKGKEKERKGKGNKYETRQNEMITNKTRYSTIITNKNI